MKIAISAESTIDLPKELLEQYDIHTLPFTVLLGDNAYADGEITINDIVEYVGKTNILPKTSAINEFQFKEHFDSLLKDYDAIIHFSLSSEISCACQNAFEAAKSYKNVYVVDSRVLSTGIALEAIYAAKLAKKGLSPQEIVDKCKARIPNMQVSFVLARLDYLYKGGRCSALALFGANILKLRLQIIVKDGKMGPGKKYRGNMTACIKKYVEDTLEEFNNPDLSTVFITSTTATEEQVSIVKEMLKERGFKNIYATCAGATISSHCGENTLGILYINDGGVDGLDD